jgi:hypothetical protein
MNNEFNIFRERFYKVILYGKKSATFPFCIYLYFFLILIHIHANQNEK